MIELWKGWEKIELALPLPVLGHCRESFQKKEENENEEEEGDSN